MSTTIGGIANAVTTPAAADLFEIEQAIGPASGKITWSNLQTAMFLNAPLTGVPTAPTAAGGTNTTQIATTAFVTSAVAAKSITLTGDVTGSGTGSFAATLATAQPSVHTWALAQTFTVAPVFTDASGTRTALGVPAGSGNSTGTNTGDPASTSKFYSRAECNSTQATDDWNFGVAGTGAAFAAVATGTTNAFGIQQAQLGTVATNRCSLAVNGFTSLLFGIGVATFETSLRIRTLSNGTDTFSARIGFIDSITAESTDGAFFRYTDSVNTGKWQAVTRSNGVETATDTGITAAVSTTTMSKFQVIVNAAGTSAAFYIAGTLVATNTTNIPTAAGRETGYGIMFLRTAGTTAVSAADIDYAEVSLAFTTLR